MNKRELIINLSLLAAIAVIGYLIVTTGLAKQRIREEADRMHKEIAAMDFENGDSEASTQPIASETTYVVAQDRFVNFGLRPLFDVPIPKPTPSPTPEPTPIPIPPLEQILAQWKLQGIVGQKALVQDVATNETITLELNGEPHMLALPPFNFMITMIAAEKSRNPTIELRSDQHTETYKLQMFPPAPAPPE